VSSFPSPRTHFVGRGRDLARLSELFASGAPLVTLWGPPGIGKTRLAIEACRTRPDQSWFCDLVPACDADDIRRVVARELGASNLEDALARLDGVIVLDNFERVTAHAAATVGAWSALNPKLTFLVTSRERLRLDGEIALEVTPLEEAVELFIDRARAAVSAFDDGVDPELISEVVARLEGIPLAVELAAARVDIIGVNGLAARLRDHQLELLGHGTLRHAIDSSFAMLGAAEQSVFAQCAVF
jgi:predicted ATPase